MTKKYALCTRQICFILIAYNVCSKLLLYPNDLAFSSGGDMLFSALADILFQTAVVWATSFLCSRTDRTFYGLLKDTLGGIAAKIIICLFSAFFLLAALYPLLENKLYVHTVFYDTIPSLVVFLPFFAFSVYAGAKGLRNAARCADICLPLFAAALAFIFVLSFGEFDAGRLLPVLKTPLVRVGGGALYTLHFFSEGAFMLAFMGRFEYKRGDCAKITLSYALGGAAVMVFLALFYGIFASLSVGELYAVSRVSSYFPAIDVIGRVDLVALYALETVSLFYITLNIQLCCECIGEAFPVRAEWISLAANAVLLICTVLLDNRFVSVSRVYSEWLWIAYVLWGAVMPLTAWILRRRRS